MSDWWTKKLAPQQEQQQKYGLTVPTYQPQYQPQPVPQQQYQQPVSPARPGEPRQNVMDPNRARNAEVTFGEAMRNWRGGEAHRTDGDCPNCGSPIGYTSYSGQNAGGARIAGLSPRPHCFECGYNGAFMQGMQSSWA